MNMTMALLRLAGVPLLLAASNATAAPLEEKPLDGQQLSWVHLAGGTFAMGSGVASDDAMPVHQVTVTEFDIAKAEITVKQYQACVEAGACTAPHWDDGKCHVPGETSWAAGVLPQEFRQADLPVVCVDWEQARAFAAWAGGRLCTEGEWEYAARSTGKERKYPWGSDEATCERAVMGGSDPGCGQKRPQPPCSKEKGTTEQGVCDMAGNVSEWVDDWYRPYPETAQPTAQGPMVGDVKLFRGGSWTDGAWRLTVQTRRKLGPTRSAADRGVRICK